MDSKDGYFHIIELILSGNQQAYSELYEKTIQYVYKNVHFLVDETADVDDLVQDIYIQVFRSIKKYDRERQFNPWLMGIVIKQIKGHRRRRWMSLRIAKKAEQYKEATEVDFSGGIIEKIANQQLVRLVIGLPYKLKQVIILRYFNDYSQEEVAKILDIPLGTVKSRINAALKKLRDKDRNLHFSEKARNSYEY